MQNIRKRRQYLPLLCPIASFLAGIIAKLAPDDSGYINLSNHREAAVRLDERKQNDKDEPQTSENAQ